MRPRALEAPGEWLFAFLMAISPIIGSVWTEPFVTKWSVFGVGVATALGVVAVGLKPLKAKAP
ncbi:MAG: hypothetical protein ACRDYY_18025 [Acidimicrobiales bacterium]